MQLSLQIFSKNSVEESFPVFLIQFIAMQNILLKNMKTNSSGIVFIFLMAKFYLKRKNLIIGSITKENANFGIMKDGKQAAIANRNGMSNTNKFELRQKLNCQKLSMNILKQNNLSRYYYIIFPRFFFISLLIFFNLSFLSLLARVGFVLIRFFGITRA